MALTNSWPGVNGAATTTDARKALAGLIETDAAGAVRSGVFPSSTSAIVTARADMNVDIAVFQGVANQFGGPILIANDGVAQLPSVLVSPGAGTNYYVVYAKQNESTAPGTDASNTKVFGAQLSTTSFAAARAALPTGALELATVQMPTGKTATNNAGVTITQTFQYTAAEGGVVWLRNSTEQAAWTPADGSLGWRMDTSQLVVYMANATTPGWYAIGGKPTLDVVTFTGIYSAGSPTPRVVSLNGRVSLDGFVAGTSGAYTAGSSYTLGTIPSTLAPVSSRSFQTMINGILPATITVTSGGTVAIIPSGTFTSTLSAPLDGCSWAHKGL